MRTLGINAMSALNVAADAMRRDDWERAERQPPTVQGVIDMLNPYWNDTPDAVVHLFGDLRLDGSLLSYQGYYDQLALGYCFDDWDKEEQQITVDGLVKLLESAIGENFEGYKGGDYTMGPRTHVWLANYGRSNGAVITGINAKMSDEDRLYLDARMVYGLHGEAAWERLAGEE